MLLKIVLFAIVTYFIFRKVFSIIGFVLGRNPRTRGYSQPPRKEGEISVDYKPGDGKRSNGKEFKEGEYIDFEEIE
jgi:hypothetical protein